KYYKYYICITTITMNTVLALLPHITDCFSANMETFRCRWSSGTYANLSEPGALRLFYLNKPSVVEWLECPQYSPNECFFSEEHTTVWNTYRVQLRSRDQRTVFNESVFIIYDRVRPDPPYNLSWSSLNGSVSGQFYDVLVSWSPPESADVRSGWMRLQYQLQHRDASSDLPIYSMENGIITQSITRTNGNIYEVRVRCKMFGMKFGDFSKSIHIYQTSKVLRFPVVPLLIFAALCLAAILMLVIISQQEKLMVLLLPQIPGPKIRGIDPELLKLRELTSILGPSELRSELYDDPWVEFIELDLEEHQELLLGNAPFGESRVKNCISFRDDDSGRASCCEPDLHSDTESMPSHPPTVDETAGPSPHTPLSKEAMYTQVSEVRPSGKVVLSPEDLETCSTQKQSTVKNTAGKTSQEEDVSLPPAPVYTVVDGVGGQNSLLLTPVPRHTSSAQSLRPRDTLPQTCSLLSPHSGAEKWREKKIPTTDLTLYSRICECDFCVCVQSSLRAVSMFVPHIVRFPRVLRCPPLPQTLQ
uniref:Growth hormone receptor b n=1 Tax=Neogobius melanostomus TaxID=47308 RepID=A0A8C6TJI1_9GOBI